MVPLRDSNGIDGSQGVWKGIVEGLAKDQHTYAHTRIDTLTIPPLYQYQDHITTARETLVMEANDR